MNLETLEKLVIRGESQQLEFKKSTGQRSDGAKAVCAMLNGKGGYVLFGVTDKGEIRGQDISASTLENIARELRKIDPPIFPDIQTVRLENGKRVIVLVVEGGSGLYSYDRSFPHVSNIMAL